ncbi:InlB B-repeat-containing protein [Kitasatospora sp. NBC_01287]|uniref:LamG-like jellyroll fold domain-containing protein n=1 Tax=Kitasatospora sp. NBC_01287 TaxID=2903573 RepID=UPI0022547955|nr:LamG-like jellyroll fold domain-containing protein [Kitasatospora sp. NBC_01287]MCX4750494.1 InlB B-repeat-containing protein [Kitasatospora sp. NBC_01287]
MAVRPRTPRRPRQPLPPPSHRPLRRLSAAALSTTLALAGLALSLAAPATADPAYDSRDSVLPVVSYTFDNDSGTTVADSSGHANNGTWSGTPAYAAGVSGKALHVSAGKNFVTLPKTAGQTDGSGSFSFETWWYDNAETADAPLVANQNFASCANAGFTFYHLSGGYQQRSCYGVGTTKTYSATRTTSIQNGWHHLAVVQDSTAHTYSYYVDGALSSTTSTISGSTAANFDSGSPIRIGQDGTGAYSATDDALVDDFDFYDQAVSATQIAADYAATNPATHFPVTVTDDGHGWGTASVLAPAAGTTDTLTATPATGYSFKAWVPVSPSMPAVNGDGTFTAPGSAVTVQATFAPDTYAVSYDGNGADGGTTAAQTLTYDQAATLSANGFTATGKQFAGWSTTPSGAPRYADQAAVKNLTATANGSITLYARWAPAGAFAVTATGDSHVTVSTSADPAAGWAAPGSTVTLSAAPATGYSSTWQAVSPAGLVIAADGSFTMPAQNTVIKAVSSANPYGVVFDGNGATGGATPAQQFSYDQGAALTANGFTRAGYGFLGWATSPTGPLAYTAGQRVDDLTATAGAQVTLYAVWGRFRAAGDTAAPVASYDFDADKNAVVSDSSGQGGNASWKGAATYAKGGLSGLAAHVSAGSNFIQLPVTAGRTDGSGSFSFSTWWGEYGETSDSALVSNQDSSACYNPGTSLYHLSGTSTTRACWGQPTGTTRQYSATSPTALQGNWHYLTVVVDRGAQTLSYYVDGTLVTTSSAGQLTAATNLASGLPFTIGQDGTGAYAASVDALVDDFDFYNQPLTAAQVANDYNATKPAATALPDESTVDVQAPVSTLPAGFVTDTFHAPPARVNTAVTQPVAGLWHGDTVTSYTKAGGDPWLTVDANGVVSGTAPGTAPQHPGTITVRATDGTTSSTITVEVPVLAAGDAPQLAAATWNLWDAGTHVDDSRLKDLAVIAGNGLDVIGVQEDGGTLAQQLAQALGWHAYEGTGGLGIVSAWPISAAGVVAATGAAPAVGVTVNVAGRDVRVWDAALDESAYGPEQACAKPGTDAAAITAAEKGATRYAQAQAIAAAIGPDAAAAGGTPVLLLGDLASPSAADWTSATAAAHCGIGAVDWPVPDAVTGTGLADSFRVANPDPAAAPGNTWSPIEPVDPATGAAEPQDRIDYVDYAGSDLHVLGSNTLVAGWPSATDTNTNAWTSDHTAVVTTFTLGTPLPATPAPTVSTATSALVYQVGHGPSADALRAAIGVSTDPADASVTVDAGHVDYGTVGHYTVLVTAASNGYVSDPVAVTVQVVPVVTITLAHSSVPLPGLGLTQAAVLDGLGATLDTTGTTGVDLSQVDTGATGSYPVTVTGTDDHGFTATARATVVITSPDLPPVLTTAVSPGTADGRNGWYASAPTLTATAVDDSGTAPAIEYRTGTGDWTAYTGPLSAPDGELTYQFRATDDAGHVSAPVAVPVRVDRTAPSTTAAAAPGATIIAPVTVTLIATDAGSGVARTEYQLGSGDWTAYTGPFTVQPLFTDQAVSYRSTDTAGNGEPPHHLVVPAIAPVAPAITTSAPAASYGTAATVTVAISSPGLPATGTVTLTEGSTARGSAALANGTAAFTLPVGLAAGGHVLLASYAGSDLLTPVTQTLVVTVGLPPAWSASAVYDSGAKVSYQGAEYTASWYTRNQQPGDPQGPWQQLAMTEDGTALWTASRTFKAGDLAVYEGRTFKADWSTRDQPPGSVTGPWEEQAPLGPNGVAAWTPTTVYDSGAQVTYQGGTYQARWYTRNQAPGTANGPWKRTG